MLWAFHAQTVTLSRTPFQVIGLSPSKHPTGKGITVGIIDAPVVKHYTYGPTRCTLCSVGNLKDEGDKQHGQCIAAIIAGKRPSPGAHGYGSWGVAPDAHIISFDHKNHTIYDQVLDNPSIACINLSLSFSGDSLINYMTNQFIPKAYNNNKVVIFSACNDGFDLSLSSHGGFRWPEQLLKAAERYPNVIIAGSVTYIDHACQYGLSGCANYLSTSSSYKGSYITAPSTVYCQNHDNPEQMFTKYGTSYSAPFISGAIALLKERFPHFNAPTLVALATLSARYHTPATPTDHELTTTIDWILEHSSFTFKHQSWTSKIFGSRQTKPLRCILDSPTDEQQKMNELVKDIRALFTIFADYKRKQAGQHRYAYHATQNHQTLQKLTHHLKHYKIVWLNQAIDHITKAAHTTSGMHHATHNLCDLFVELVIVPLFSRLEEMVIFSDSTIHPHERKALIHHLELWNRCTKVRADLNIDRALTLAAQAGHLIHDHMIRTGQFGLQLLMADFKADRMTEINRMIKGLEPPTREYSN
jgi:hypothetical protein